MGIVPFYPTSQKDNERNGDIDISSVNKRFIQSNILHKETRVVYINLVAIRSHPICMQTN